jgi:hypothetical protein
LAVISERELDEFIKRTQARRLQEPTNDRLYSALVDCLYQMKTNLHASAELRQKLAFALFRMVTDDPLANSALGRDLMSLSEIFDA